MNHNSANKKTLTVDMIKDNTQIKVVYLRIEIILDCKSDSC